MSDDLTPQQSARLACDRLSQPRGWQPRADYLAALRRDALPGMELDDEDVR